MAAMSLDAAFRALADPSRRALLDRLRDRDGQTLSELCEGLAMTRQAVAKHLAVLEEANLVATLRRGREKLHHLNRVPIDQIADRWIEPFHRGPLAALAGLKNRLEGETMANSRFVYVTYIRTTAEKLWQALTEPEFTRRYWAETRQESTWEVGAPWRSFSPKGEVIDSGEILEIDRPRRLVLTWRVEIVPEMQAEGFTRLTYELEEQGDTVKLTLTHEIDREGSTVIAEVATGWPAILASLKSLLETGQPLEATTRWPGED